MGRAIRRRLGERVRQLRLERGFTQGDLSERAGEISPEMISRIEQGQGCSLDTVEALAKALRVGAADLFDDRDGKDVPHFKPAAMRVARLLSEADEETLEAVLKVAQVLTRRSRS